MKELNDFLISASIFLVGMISIGVGRILESVSKDSINSIVSSILVVLGVIVIIFLLLAWVLKLNYPKETQKCELP